MAFTARSVLFAQAVRMRQSAKSLRQRPQLSYSSCSRSYSHLIAERIFHLRCWRQREVGTQFWAGSSEVY
jgi:hypothetical protein